MSSFLSPAIIAALYSGTLNTSLIGTETFSSLLRRDDFVPEKISPILRFRAQEDAFDRIFANEIVRFTSASLESIAGIVENPLFPKSAGWDVVRLYYAAYYSAHSLMRLFGHVCTRIDFVHKHNFCEVAARYGLRGSIDAGVYYGSIDKFGVVSLDLVKANGVHDAFWRAFVTFIDELKSKLDSIADGGQISRSDVISAKSDFDKIKIIFGSADNWLSTIRNNANYSFQYGLWYPYKDQVSSNKNIRKIIRKFNSEYVRVYHSKILYDVDGFLHCANVLVNFNACLLSDLSLFVKKKNFIRRHLAPLLDDASLFFKRTV